MTDSPPSFNQEQVLSETKKALLEEDWRAAVNHLSQLIDDDPNHPENLACLEEWMNKAGPIGLDLIPVFVDEGLFAPTTAIRAELMSRLGFCDGSLELILQVICSRQDDRYCQWILDWFDRVGWSEGLRVGELVKSFERSLGSLRESELSALSGLISVFDRALEHAPNHDRLSYLRAIVARRVGDERAFDLAQEYHSEFPGYWGCVALGGVLREKGELEEAINIYREGLDYEPEDVGLRLDLGDLLHDVGDLENSLDAYEEALERKPGEPWATASITFIRYALAGELGLRYELDDLAKSGNRRALRFLFWLETYRSHLPTPNSSIVAVAMHAIEKRVEIENLSVSSLEPPSAIMALDYALNTIPSRSFPKLSFTDIPDPDPRKARKLTRFSLWVYKGMVARPAMDPPSRKIANAVSEIARTPFDAARWSEMARLQANRLRGLEQEFLAVMCQPPTLPEGDEEPWSWPFRVQVAAALMITRSSQSWASRRKTIRDLLFGIVDWTTTAAIVALTQLSEDEPELGHEIFLDLIELFGEEEAGPIWYQCVLFPLFQCLPRLPLPEELRTIIVGLRARAGLP